MSVAAGNIGQSDSLGAFVRALHGFAGSRSITAILLVVLGSLLEGVGILLLIPLLGIVFGPNAGTGMVANIAGWVLDVLPAYSTGGQLALLLLMFAVLIAIRGVIIVRRDVLVTRLQAEFVNAHRLLILDLLTRSQWSTVSRLRHGRIAHILGTDVHNLRSAAHFIVQGGVAGVMLLAQGILALLIAPVLAVLVFLFLGLSFAFLHLLLSRARRLGSEVADANLSLSNSTIEFLNGLKVSLSQNLHRGFLSAFRRGSHLAAEREVAFAKQRAISQAALTGVAAAVGGFVLLAGVTLVPSPMPALVALIFIMARMTGPTTQIQQGAQQIFNTLPAFSHLKQLEAELSKGADSSDAWATADRLVAPEAIAFKDVCFDHSARANSGESGLTAFSLHIPPGSFLGVKGASGAGKTTLADLLVGLFPPQSGIITVGGQPLEGALLQSWRESISYVSQDPFLYHTTVRENLLWARSGASEADLWRAAEIAGAEASLRRLPEGLDTVVGERGCLLSGGERQRIALARALIRRPVLLLLDEATNAIDVSSESLILERLAKMNPRPTIVIVAHRESSLAFCDRIIKISQGRLVGNFERPSHDS